MNNTPRCIRQLNVDFNSEFALRLARPDDSLCAEVSCPCGNDIVCVLGYYVNSDAANGKQIFVGPLGMKCSTCSLESEIMDPEVHGYNGEIGSNTTMRGSGPRRTWHCPTCKNEWVRIAVVFSYQVEVDDVMSKRPEDYFDVFQLFAECYRCNGVSTVSLFDCT